MRPISYRHEFIDTLMELTALSSGQVEGAAKWSAEYFSRGKTWYRFDGAQEPGNRVSEGLAFDPVTGEAPKISAHMLTCILLNFQNNAFIGAYAGDARLSTGIASELLPACDRVPEIVAVSIESKGQFGLGRMTEESTQFVFVGFERLADAARARRSVALADGKAISRHWCRGRIRLVDDAIFHDD